MLGNRASAFIYLGIPLLVRAHQAVSNVYVYGGRGADPDFVAFSLAKMKQLLDPAQYVVRRVSWEELAEPQWQGATSLVVMPGGRDVPYLQDLVGMANSNLVDFVSNGGKYLGLCAGAYYGSNRVEFEMGTDIEVVGDRPLKFFPGTCRGSTFGGYSYTSGADALAANLTVTRPLNPENGAPIRTPVFFKGGGAFLNATAFPQVEVLATYDGVTDPAANAAVVLCGVGNSGGQALLSAVHPEYQPSGVFPTPDALLTPFQKTIDLTLQGWLQMLGLALRPSTQRPSLTAVHLSGQPIPTTPHHHHAVAPVSG